MDMDWPEFSEFSTVSRQSISPRRELQLQGPRPAPLKVSKDSHKIKKPPTAPIQPHQHQQHHPPYQQQQQYQQQRQPVIIYTVSPKVIHTNASEFMSLVQRLTGPSPRPRSPCISSGAISPAARFATIEKTNTPSEANKSTLYYNNNNTTTLNRISDHLDLDLDLDLFGPEVERTSSFPGILSPVPSTLPLVSPNFFSPPSDHNINNNTNTNTNNNNLLLHDWSPVFNKNFFEGGGFMPSPNSGFLTAPITSPNLPFDLFNQFLDF